MTETLLDYGDILTRYQRMRKASFELNKVLPRYVSKEGMEATARRLGFWHKGTLVFDTMDQSCVLFDQAIHGYFKDGRNAVDRYLADHPPAPGSDQEAALAAMQRSFHSLFQVEGIVPGTGVHVHDILRDRRHFLTDVGFSQTAVEGLALATRVLPFEDFIMTAGAQSTESVSILGYNQLISRLNLGLGSAVSVLIFFSVLIISFVYIKGFGAKLSEGMPGS